MYSLLIHLLKFTVYLICFLKGFGIYTDTQESVMSLKTHSAQSSHDITTLRIIEELLITTSSVKEAGWEK